MTDTTIIEAHITSHEQVERHGMEMTRVFCRACDWERVVRWPGVTPEQTRVELGGAHEASEPSKSCWVCGEMFHAGDLALGVPEIALMHEKCPLRCVECGVVTDTECADCWPWQPVCTTHIGHEHKLDPHEVELARETQRAYDER